MELTRLRIQRGQNSLRNPELRMRHRAKAVSLASSTMWDSDCASGKLVFIRECI
ncbi:hypothetical protein CCYS_12115 [Corynebacterium cystitidis DSM 20524]|uniref:Uncharacterized protein n=1 Tax=Corynebacterium cystitidis DSM 20524 TaxID=1121357 RepID=A0A1H9V6V2_9CORY|nr:hypothetical protein CCYS_12115 [Corynebacterium cystitidis DSM 20524]SES17445.1 hypothetical protein SAMN05661109_02104 [Corynebacterium cystitidis DSM 20524]SNV63486.1 Uncharacterised protein [Corynebacterium cystitidis]